MGALVGLVFALGGLSIAAAFTVRPRRRWSDGLAGRTRQLLSAAGYPTVPPAQLYLITAVAAGAVLLFATALSGSPPIAAAFAGFAAASPWAALRWRAGARAAELRELWPDAVDNLASAVRAGLSLPEAVAQLAERGPSPLRDAFRRFAEDYRCSGLFGTCLDRLKAELADPVADRIVESLRLAREVGGADLGLLLRSLSRFLREDARVRGEVEARQSWTVNAARLALAAPWVVLGLLSLRPGTVRAYDTAAGVLVLFVGGGVSLLAYRLMRRIGRLPADERVLR